MSMYFNYTGMNTKTWSHLYMTIYVRQYADSPYNEWIPIRYWDVSNWDPINKEWGEQKYGDKYLPPEYLAPFTWDGHLMVRMRPIFEALGVKREEMGSDHDAPWIEPGSQWYPTKFIWMNSNGSYLRILRDTDDVLIYDYHNPNMQRPYSVKLPHKIFINGNENTGEYTFIPLRALTTTFKEKHGNNYDQYLTFFEDLTIEWCEHDRYSDDGNGNVLTPEGLNLGSNVDTEWLKEMESQPSNWRYPEELTGWSTNPAIAKFKLGPKIIITRYGNQKKPSPTI